MFEHVTECTDSKDVDTAAYINAADAIRERFNCLLVIIHHCGVDGTRPRGHTSLTGAIDAQLSVKRDNAKQIVTTVEHMKDGAEGETLVSTLTVVEVGLDDDGDKCALLAWSAVRPRTRKKEAMLEMPPPILRASEGGAFVSCSRVATRRCEKASS